MTLRLFPDPGPVRQGFAWDHTRWDAEFTLLTLGDRKDIARLCRVHPEAEWPQRSLQFTLARALRTINGRAPANDDWEKELGAASETLVDRIADAYREARLTPSTPPEDPEALEGARAACRVYLDRIPSFTADEDGAEIFSLLAPIPRYVWWAGAFHLVSFHVLTLDERRLIARLLGMIPKDQVPHVEVQQTLARAIHSVNEVAVTDAIGAGLDARMDWVEEFPESLIAVLAAHYDAAKEEPRGQLYGMLSDPK